MEEVLDYETMLETAYSSFLRPGMTVVDVGAHRGRHTARFADIVGPRGTVIAFEPLPHMARFLRDTFGEVSNVEIREVALADRSGATDFVHVENAPGESGLRERVSNIEHPVRSMISVHTSTLDEQCASLDSLDYVKMDIEGGEIDCLRGAADTIGRFRPLVSVEYGAEAYRGYGHTTETLFDHCEADGVRDRHHVRARRPLAGRVARSLRSRLVGLRSRPARDNGRMAARAMGGVT